MAAILESTPQNNPIVGVIPAIEHPQLDDDTRDDGVGVPFLIDDETFPIPARCDDETVDNSGAHPSVGGLWVPGRPLIISYVTWNMGQLPPNPQEVADFCIRPNAHIVVVNTQENGPYVGLNTQHVDWERLLENVCLQHKYQRVACRSLWAIHLAVYARQHDVAKYIREIEVGVQKTGAVKGAMGNKGGVAIAMSLSLRESTMTRVWNTLNSPRAEPEVAEHDTVALAESIVDTNTGTGGLFSPYDNDRGQVPPPPGGSTAAVTAINRVIPKAFVDSLKSVPNTHPSALPELSLLFIGTHLTAHQHNTEARNRDYMSIIRELPVGRKGVYASKFERSSCVYNSRKAASPSSIVVDESNGIPGHTVEAPPPSSRDVTSEFDLCLFGGDLNYRLNGSWRAIEFIINHRKSLRSVLIHNDQLIANMKQGKVFHGFEEGQLHFRPTYKYALVAGVTQDEYAFSHKAPRMPSYCDRILLKTRPETVAQHPVQLRLYTDCPGVRSSDHRPVVGMWEVSTTLVLDGGDGDDTPWEPQYGSCGCLDSMGRR